MANFPVQSAPFDYDFNQGMLQAVQARMGRANAAEQEAKNPYVGQRELEALIMDKLKNQYYGREKESEIGLRGAQATHLNQQTRLLPLEDYIKANTSLRSNSRFGRSYEFMRALNAMDAPSKSAWIAQHQDDYNQMLSELGSQPGMEGGKIDNNNNLAENMVLQELMKLNGLPKSGAMQGASMQPRNEYNNNSSELANSLTSALTNNQASEKPQSPDLHTAVMQTLPVEDRPKSDDPDIAKAQDDLAKARFSSSASQTQQIQDMALLNATRKSNTAANNSRSDGAKVLDLFLKESRTPENIKKFKNVADHYSGQTGEAKAWLEGKLPESLQSDAYKDYIWYTTQFQKAVTSTVKQMEKLNGDQRQIASLNQLTDVLHDPKLGGKGALKTFNNAIGTLQDMSDAIFKASEIPQARGIYKRMYNLPEKYKEYVPSSSEKSDKVKVKVDGVTHEIDRSRLEDAKRDAQKADVTIEVSSED